MQIKNLLSPIIFTIFFMHVAFAGTTFKEIEKFSEINSSIDENTLVLLDLDDTVFTAGEYNGSYKYYVDQLRLLTHERKISLEDARHEIFPKWFGYQANLNYKITDTSLNNFISEVHKNKSLVFGFTARRFATADLTLKKLATLDIKFDLEDLKFERAYYNHSQKNKEMHVAKFEQGIVFCYEFNEKGKVFFDWFNWLKKEREANYNKIIFVDDTIANLQSVSIAAVKLGLEFEGYLFKVKYQFENK